MIIRISVAPNRNMGRLKTNSILLHLKANTNPPEPQVKMKVAARNISVNGIYAFEIQGVQLKPK
jgi:hypothetical protein